MEQPIKLIWTFMLDYTKGWGVHRHDHDYFQMYYCLAGAGTFFLDGRKIELQKGDCMIIRPNQVHELYPIPSGQLRVIDTKFEINDEAIYQAVLEMPEVVQLESSTFRELQQTMRGEWVSGEPYARDVATLLFQHSLYIYLRQNSRGSSTVPFYHELENRIQGLSGIERKIADYLGEHYLEQITLDELATELRYSKNYLCKVFKVAAGCTIGEYCNFLRIRKAYDLVCCSDRKLTEIAVNCGFSSIHYFSRIFRKVVGMSPSQVRDQDQNALNTDIQLHGTFRYRYYTENVEQVR